jgi:flagellar biosynthesis/type III secretory pathway protein FliH
LSEAVLAVPLSRLFAAPLPPAGPTVAERLAMVAAEARAEGWAAAEAELLPRLAALEAELAAAQAEGVAAANAKAQMAGAALAALESALAEAVAVLGVAIARRVLATEPAVDAQTLAGLVEDALAGLGSGDAGQVRMHPDDAPNAPALPAGWALAADPGLARGEVVAERGPALSGAGLALRLARLGAALEEGR